MGLNDSYSTVRGQILLMNPLSSVRQVYSSVSQEEKQRLLSSTHAAVDSGGNAAMAVRSKSTSIRSKRYDRQLGSPDFRSHEKQLENLSGVRRVDHDRGRTGSGRGSPNYTHCGNMGHWIQTCYEIIGYPVGHPKAKGPRRYNNNNRPANNINHTFPIANHVSEGFSKDDGNKIVGISQIQMQQLLSLIDNKNEGSNSQANATIKPGLSIVNSCNWIIDSGATDHISSLSNLFFCKNKNCSLPSVLLPSGEKANIVSKGSLFLNSVYYLHDVLCVPTFKVDLMSVRRLTRALNCSITFFPYWCVLQDLATRRMIGLGKQNDGLYYMVALTTEKTKITSPVNRPACNLTLSSTDLWHKRLCHASPPRLSFIAKNFKIFSIQSNNARHICPLAKQSRLPVSPSVISSIKPFDLIHCDIWGHYRHSSLSSAYYFLTIVDDFACFTWIFLMRHKD
ncbi:hypothetical protein LWI28_026548 [Acer negundo]|uniref:GAG-pre-integrase domain-containing protein n=1 Tax=Acer negundo TaxID=4023 RepID=A0AAD5I7L0_ACENE|nr:hypothetical protein LWI28_026548 [Acer negundo]